MRVLVRTNRDLRSLFLAYPEVCLLGTLQQHSRPVYGLIQASRALHYHSQADFDSQRTLALLEQSMATEWSTEHHHIPKDDVNPLKALDGLFAMCEDVNHLVEVYAQSTAAAIEQVVNPWAEYTPISLSTSEFTHIATTFWMLRVFYQLQLLSVHHEPAKAFVRAFINDLQPWQVQQCFSVEYFLGTSACSTYSSTVYILIGDMNGTRSALSMTSCFLQDYYETTSFSIGQGNRFLTTFTMAAACFRAVRYSAAVIPSAPWLRSQPDLGLDVSLEHVEHAASQLRNDGWSIYESLGHHDPARPQQHHQFFLHMGMFFWDPNRLEHWDFINPDDFPDIVCMFRASLDAMKSHRYWGRCVCCQCY